MSLVRRIGPVAVLALLAGGAIARPKHAFAPEPVQEGAPQAGADAQAKLALDLLRRQPAGLPLIGDTLGWVKRCTGTPSVCTVSRGFALDPVVFPSLKVSFVTTPNAGTHVVAVLVPLDQSLKDGLVLHGDGKDGFLGSYSRCSKMGCAGDATLTDKAYDSLIASKNLDVVLVDVNGRTVMYQAPLAGLEAAIGGPALSDEEFRKAALAAGKELIARMQALQAKTKAEDEAFQPESGNKPPSAGPASVDAATTDRSPGPPPSTPPNHSD